ncbi:MAG: hypothetical protein SCH71_04150 [Desulfobulbaceae bacterium]|nr:hypothetical protein [Desulfobulbaceae bacterium]
MIFHRRYFLLWYPVLFWSFFQAGCAARLPASIPLAEEQRGEILAHYQSFQKRDCSIPLDADISLDARSFGKNWKSTGFFLIQPPSRLRMTIVDPVGRPLFILIAAENFFTLVNTGKGEALVGSAAALAGENEDFAEFRAEDVISLLTGRFLPPPFLLTDMRRDKESDTFVWLVFAAAAEKSHNILFDPDEKRIVRHIFADPGGEILLDIRYGPGEENSGTCSMPDALVITGSAVGGEVTLRYDLVMPRGVIPESNFELTLPEHYNIRRMEGDSLP